MPVGGGGHCTRYVAMHPLRGDTPVTWRYTRSERVQCLRIGCNAYGSGAPHNARIPQRRVCRPARITHRQKHTKPQDPQEPPAWRAPEGPEGPSAVPAGGGGARPTPHSTEAAAGMEGAGGPGCGARGRRRGLAGLRGDASNHTSVHRAPLVWRAPEGPEGTGGLRGAAPNEVRPPSLAGGRALRRPEHPWRHKQHHQLGGPPPTGASSSPAHRHPQRHEAATGFPAAAS